MTDLERAREVVDATILAAIKFFPTKDDPAVILDVFGLREALRATVSAAIATARADAYAEAIERAEACAQSWIDMRPEQIRLLAGEMTAQEIRTAKAVAGGIVRAIRALAPPSAP